MDIAVFDVLDKNLDRNKGIILEPFVSSFVDIRSIHEIKDAREVYDSTLYDKPEQCWV